MILDPHVAGHVLLMCRVAIAATFAWSAAGKLRDLGAFQSAIESLALVPGRWASRTAGGVLAAEVAAALLVTAGGPVLLPGFMLATCLLTGFSVVLVVALRRGTRSACNCFGPSERPLSPFDVVRNTLLGGFCLLGWWMLSTPRQPLDGFDLALAAPMATGLVLVVVNVEDVVTTLRRPFTVFDEG